MAAADDPTAREWFLQQILPYLFAGAPHSAGYAIPAPDPVLDPNGHAAYTRSVKRPRAEAMARHVLALYPPELTQREALSPIPTKLSLLGLHALTPRQATQHELQKSLFLAHMTRQFRVELQKHDDDIAGRKEAMIEFGEAVCNSIFGPDWFQSTQLMYGGKATPSSIYSDHGAYDDGYYYDQPAASNLCAKHAAAAAASETPVYTPASVMQSKLQKSAGDLAQEGMTAANRKQAKDDLRWELLRWDSTLTRKQALDGQEELFDEYGIDDYEAYSYLYGDANDHDDPYSFMDYYKAAYPYDDDDPEAYIPYYEELHENYDEYLNFVKELRRSEIAHAMESSKELAEELGFGSRTKRRGKNSRPGKQASAATNSGQELKKEGSAGAVKNEKGKEKLDTTMAGAAPSTSSTFGSNTAEAAPAKSDFNTPQKSFSSLQIFKSPLHAGSPLGTQSSPSLLTTASVGLNLAKPAAAIGGFSYQLPKAAATATTKEGSNYQISNPAASSKGGFSHSFLERVDSARMTLPKSKGPTAEELRREFLQKSAALLVKTKTNAQKQDGAKKGVAGSGSGGGSTPGLSSSGKTKAKEAETSKAKGATVDPAKTASKVPSPYPAVGEWKVIYKYEPPPKPKPAAPKRKKEPSSSSSDTFPLAAKDPGMISKPAKKKLNPTPAATSTSTQTKPQASASGTTAGKTSKQRPAKTTTSAGVNSKPVKPKPAAGVAGSTQTKAQKPKEIKYQVVVFKKPFLPSKRPQRDCWHGRVWA
ncbi:uncharacterized protein SPSC_01744 [Sporisorium scitamineum]|uniref:Uncharacterized protein n=1 Tax=Sporisorium scitamineum TaxID=49012 RepID=A0A0F7S4H0_9BASI|nr:uncharacterized protein SPSC_01744 [Sporisorium scitamineum]CDW94355.1 hypothetical protein [Sporisorium scitamineum]